MFVCDACAHAEFTVFSLCLYSVYSHWATYSCTLRVFEVPYLCLFSPIPYLPGAVKPTLPCTAQTTLPRCEYLPTPEVSEKLLSVVYGAMFC